MPDAREAFRKIAAMVEHDSPVYQIAVEQSAWLTTEPATSEPLPMVGSFPGERIDDVEWAREFIADCESLAEERGASFGTLVYERLRRKLYELRTADGKGKP